MLQLRDLQTDTKTVTVEVDGQQADVTFQPSKLTAALEEKADAEYWERGRQLGALAYILSEVLVEWDLYDGDDRIPTTFDAIKELPSPFLVAVIDTVREESQQGKAYAGSFADT